MYLPALLTFLRTSFLLAAAHPAITPPYVRSLTDKAGAAAHEAKPSFALPHAILKTEPEKDVDMSVGESVVRVRNTDAGDSEEAGEEGFSKGYDSS
jgi:hypothetical protein